MSDRNADNAEKYILQTQQKMYIDSNETPTRWMRMWADTREFDNRESALIRHTEREANTRVVAVLETDGEKEGEVVRDE